MTWEGGRDKERGTEIERGERVINLKKERKLEGNGDITEQATRKSIKKNDSQMESYILSCS